MALSLKPVGNNRQNIFSVEEAATGSGLRLIDFPLREKPLAVSCRTNSKELPSTTAIIHLI